MKSYAITFYAERNDIEIELEITGTVSQYIPAVTHLAPENCYPSEGGEVEILSILHHGQPWNGELAEEELDNACELLFQFSHEDNDVCDWDDFHLEQSE